MINFPSKIFIVLFSVLLSFTGIKDKQQEVVIDERLSNLITKSFKMPTIDWLIPQK